MAGPSDHPMNPIQTVGAGATCLVSESLCLQILGGTNGEQMGKDIIAAFFGCGIAEYASYTCIFDSFQPYNRYYTNELLN